MRPLAVCLARRMVRALASDIDIGVGRARARVPGMQNAAGEGDADDHAESVGAVCKAVGHICARRSAAFSVSRTGNFTQTAKLSLSAYSTSASAKAVRSTGDHITGLDP